MTTGERIRLLRLKHGMSQAELGSKIGVKTPAVYKYENGLVVNLKRSTIERLANALETTPSYLMGFEDENEPAPVPKDGPASEISDLIDQLTPEQQRLILAQIKGILSNRE